MVDVEFTPADAPTSTAGERHEPSQIVAWVDRRERVLQGHAVHHRADRPLRPRQSARPLGLQRRPDVSVRPSHHDVPGLGASQARRTRSTASCSRTARDHGANPLSPTIRRSATTLTNNPNDPDPNRRPDYISCGENNLSHPFMRQLARAPLLPAVPAESTRTGARPTR